MRVEILEDRLRDSDPASGHRYDLARGDTITVSDALGARWCALGWAKDPAGAVETGERHPGAARLTVRNKRARVGARQQKET